MCQVPGCQTASKTARAANKMCRAVPVRCLACCIANGGCEFKGHCPVSSSNADSGTTVSSHFVIGKSKLIFFRELFRLLLLQSFRQPLVLPSLQIPFHCLLLHCPVLATLYQLEMGHWHIPQSEQVQHVLMLEHSMKIMVLHTDRLSINEKKLLFSYVKSSLLPYNLPSE